MIIQPEFAEEELVIEAKKQLKKKKSLLSMSKVYFKDNSYEFYGKHHEIYLNNIRRAVPKNWKTIIRQPISKRANTSLQRTGNIARH